jgi:hypothetical protein
MALTRTLLALTAFVAASAPPGAFAAADSVWQPVLRVGAIDNSQDDLDVQALDGFADRFDRLPKPLAPDAWPHIHPSRRDTWAGSRSYEFSTRAETRRRSGVYRIRIGLLGGQPYYPPLLRVSFGSAASWTLQTKAGADIGRDSNRLEQVTPQVVEYLVAGQDVPDDQTLLSVSAPDDASWFVYDGIEIDWSDQQLEPTVDLKFDDTAAMLVQQSGEGPRQQLRLTFELQRVMTPLNFTVVDQQGEVWAEATVGPAAGMKPFYGPLTADVLIHARKDAQPLDIIFRSENLRRTESLEWPGYREIELFVVPQSHFDNGYTHTQEAAIARNVESLTRAIDYAERFDNFAWTNESSYILQRWMEAATEEDRQRLLEQIRSGKIGLDAGWVNMLSGLCTDEELYRWLYFSGNFAREHEAPLTTATITDAPSHTWSIPSILKSSGIDYLAIGSNSDRSDFWKFGAERSYQPVWWEGPDGARVLTHVHKHYAQATHVGLTLSLEAAELRLPQWLADVFNDPLAKKPYPYDVVHLHGAYNDNVQLDEALPRVVAQWNAKYQWPRITLGTNAQFSARLREEAAKKAPVVRGDQGAYWEDGAGSSARETAINRANVRRLALLEMLLTGLHAEGRLRDYPRFLINHAWEHALLYDEHTWGAWNSITQPNDPSVRTQFNAKGAEALEASVHCDQLQRIVARHIPEVKTLEDSVPHAVEPVAEGLRIESAELAVTIDRSTGLISSIRRNSDGREFVEAPAENAEAKRRAPGFGQLLYDAKPRSERPGGHDTAIGATRSNPYLIDVALGSRSIVSRFGHEVLGIVELEFAVSADAPTVHVTVRLHGKRAVTDLEGVYVAFPLAFDDPAIDYEVGGATVRAGRDWMPWACLDWFSVQDFVRVADIKSGDTVVWSSTDAPLICLQDVTTHRKLRELPIKNGRIYSYILNNYWHTNYKASQGGDYEFRYALTFGDHTTLADCSRYASRWSAETATALEKFVNPITKNVKITAFKRSEDNSGYILRLREMNGIAGPVAVDVPAFAARGIQRVQRVSGLEHLLATSEDKPFVTGTEIRTQLRPFEIQTLLVTLKAAR